MQEVKRYIPKHFILAYKARRRNAVRHIAARCNTYDECIQYYMMHYQPKRDYFIYTHDWKLINSISIEDFRKETP